MGIYISGTRRRKSIYSAWGALLNETINVFLGDWCWKLWLFKCKYLGAFISGMRRTNYTTFESKLAKDGPFPTSSHTRFGVVWIGSYGRSKSGVPRTRSARGARSRGPRRHVSIKSLEKTLPSKFERETTSRFRVMSEFVLGAWLKCPFYFRFISLIYFSPFPYLSVTQLSSNTPIENRYKIWFKMLK